MSRIAIIGAGAVGGYLAAHLARSGVSVVVVDRWRLHTEQIRRQGLRITYSDARNDFIVPLEALAAEEAADLSAKGPIDIAFICTKSYDTRWAADLVSPHLSTDGYLVSLQNCINEEAIAERVGAARTMGCIASSITVELKGPGHINRTAGKVDPSYAVFRAGELDGRSSARLEEVQRLVGHADVATTTDNLLGERWSKLAINNMGAGLSAVSGQRERDFTADPAYRRFAVRLGSETVRVGLALGHRLVDIGGLAPETVLRAGEGDPAAMQQFEQAKQKQMSNPGWGVHRPSMAQDTAKGRPTEVDFMNGFVVSKGLALGIATPANAALTDMVKRLEAGEIEAHPDNITRLAAALGHSG